VKTVTFWLNGECVCIRWDQPCCPSKGDTVHIDNKAAKGFYVVHSVSWSYRETPAKNNTVEPFDIVEVFLKSE
jgi:hypothetical protein